jgi:hypothetical protein
MRLADNIYSLHIGTWSEAKLAKIGPSLEKTNYVKKQPLTQMRQASADLWKETHVSRSPPRTELMLRRHFRLRL